MKVKELIELLSKISPKADVCVVDTFGSYDCRTDLTLHVTKHEDGSKSVMIGHQDYDLAELDGMKLTFSEGVRRK